MTSILIKSFNRPLYLDRCLLSVKRLVSGWSEIRVLDDGTPAPLLDEISRRHPEVEIIKSTAWAEKASALERGDQPPAVIPTSLWRGAADSATSYFVMTEDDVWFTREIDLAELVAQAKARRIGQIRLGWLGRDIDSQYARAAEMGHGLVMLEPQPLILLPGRAMDWLFENRFRLYSLAYRMGRVTEPSPRAYVPHYWVLNSISMALWDKSYWHAVWRDSGDLVDEESQLRSAAAYYRHHRRNRFFFARVNTESVATTFQSAAANGFHSEAFDVHALNAAVNSRWLSGQLDPLEGFPGDIPFGALASSLPMGLRNAYDEWVEDFKARYRAQGCSVE